MYYSVSPYAYCAGDPINRIDVEGKYVESVWDAISIAVGVESLGGNIREGNTSDAWVDVATIAIDIAAILLPVVPGGVSVAVKAARTAKAVNKVTDGAGKVKTYQTYTKKNPKTGEIYSGRTSGTKSPRENVRIRDKNHHKNKEGFEDAILDKTSSNKDAIRGQEQLSIDKHGGAQSSGGTSGNNRNGVGSRNPQKEKYEEEAFKLFGTP